MAREGKSFARESSDPACGSAKPNNKYRSGSVSLYQLQTFRQSDCKCVTADSPGAMPKPGGGPTGRRVMLSGKADSARGGECRGVTRGVAIGVDIGVARGVEAGVVLRLHGAPDLGGGSQVASRPLIKSLF